MAILVVLNIRICRGIAVLNRKRRTIRLPATDPVLQTEGEDEGRTRDQQQQLVMIESGTQIRFESQNVATE